MEKLLTFVIARVKHLLILWHGNRKSNRNLLARKQRTKNEKHYLMANLLERNQHSYFQHQFIYLEVG